MCGRCMERRAKVHTGTELVKGWSIPVQNICANGNSTANRFDGNNVTYFASRIGRSHSCVSGAPNWLRLLNRNSLPMVYVSLVVFKQRCLEIGRRRSGDQPKGLFLQTSYFKKGQITLQTTWCLSMRGSSALLVCQYGSQNLEPNA